MADESKLVRVAALIDSRPLCAACLQVKSGITTGELPSYLHQVGQVFKVRDDSDLCRVCGRFTTVFSLTRS
jgi:geranylgeranyl pyrophosphate synthase